MRVSTFSAVWYITMLAAFNATGHNIHSALEAPTVVLRKSVSSTPTCSQSSVDGRLELRQALNLGPLAAPPVEIVAPAVPAAAPPTPLNPPAAIPPDIAPPAVDLDVAPAPAPAAALPPANQEIPPPPSVATPVSAPATHVLPLPPLVTGDDFVTVQWVETRIGKLRTWVPKTYTFHFEAMSQAPLPGMGSIGMGTLTGKTGQTQTIYMVTGAAPTLIVDAKKVAVAAVAAGVAGLVV